jgi:stress response protein YsnF
VKEEVRVSKTARREERRADAEVRREKVDIQKDGDVEQGGSMNDPED